MALKDAVKGPERKLYEVVADIRNGGRVGPSRAAKGDKVELADSEAAFLLLEGVIRLVEAPAPAGKAAKPAAAEG